MFNYNSCNVRTGTMLKPVKIQNNFDSINYLRYLDKNRDIFKIFNVVEHKVDNWGSNVY